MSHADDILPWPLIERYLAGTCSAEERAGIEQLLASHPAHRAEIEALHTMWDTVAALRPEGYDARRAWRAVDARLGEPRDSEAPRRIRKQGSHLDLWPRGVGGDGAGSRWRRFTTVAVAAVVVIGVVASATRLSSSSGAAQPFREFATQAGNRCTITLQDGTRLVLGPATRVRVSTDVGAVGRAVELDGEAYFTVVHNAQHPFSVRTTHTVVRDVGTTFVVRAYVGDREERVAVAEGEVALGANALRTADLASVDAAGRVTVRRGATLDRELAWTQGRLVFDETPVADVVRDLERTFDLHITIADSVLLSQHVTAAFGDEPADAVLDAIAGVIGAGYTRAGRTVVISRKARGAHQFDRASPLDLRTAQARNSNS